MLALVRDVDEFEGVERECSAASGPRMRIVPAEEFVVEARRLDNTLLAKRSPWLSLTVDRLWIGGLSATSEQPLAWGERVSVYVPQRDGRRGFTAYGRVMRCQAGACGYRIGVDFETFPAA